MLTVLNKSKNNDELYIQFPGEKTPAELFGGTWSAMFEDEGVFFRTPGGSALAFNGGIQNAANTAHNHDRGNMEITGEFGKQATSFSNSSNHTLGAFTWKTYKTDTIGAGSSYHGGILSFNASRAWTGRTSTDGVEDGRPKNRTFRVWKKTS